MKEFTVSGVDRTTGKSCSIVVEAPTDTAAVKIAGKSLLVESVELVQPKKAIGHDVASNPRPNLRSCPDCQGQVSQQAETCPHCGKRLHASPGHTMARILVLAILVAVLLFWMASKVEGMSE
jgi:uncharacterized paraquat-inducible protein A